MTLGELIAELKKHNPAKGVGVGFGGPHSYRGYYEDVAFAPRLNVTIGDMLRAAEGALGNTFTGWKGGEYTMGEFTDVWLAMPGDTGETIGPIFLAFMLDGTPVAAVRKIRDQEDK